MKKYKLKRDLPTFKAGYEFELRDNGNLYLIDAAKKEGHWCTQVCAYCKSVLDHFPNILTEWFEEIPKEAKTVYDLNPGDECWVVFGTGSGHVAQSIEFGLFAETLRQTGSLYLTKGEAEKAVAWHIARETIKRDTKGFKPDWENGKQEKWRVFYSHLFRDFYYDRFYRLQSEQINFATLEDARASVEAHEKEWKIYLGVNE